MIRVVLDTFNQGGWIMWPILMVSIVVWFTGLMKLYELWSLERARRIFVSAFEKGIRISSELVRTGDRHFDRLIKNLSGSNLSPVAFRMYSGSFFSQ